MLYIILILAVLVCIALEYYYFLVVKKRDVFNYENSVANLSIGICERLITIFMAPLFYGVFNYIYTHYALSHITGSWYTWLFLLMFTDFVWYWYHRLGHEVNLFWAAHIVHHQSEDYNLTIAARITIFQAYVRTIFWCILPLIGFHPDMVVDVLIIHGAYSFFTHTQVIGKLGFLEHILITPSHHRVHHASNKEYLDKNYGDVFVFWDKLFGTFRKEVEPPVYGLTQPLKSHSFLWQHFHYYLEIMAMARRKKSIKGKLGVVLGPPTGMNPDIRPELEKKWLHDKRRNMRVALKGYINFQLIVSFLLVFYLMYDYTGLSMLARAELFMLVMLTLVNCGAIIEQKKWIFNLEILRTWQLIAFISYTAGEPLMFFIPSAVFLLILNIFPMRALYFRAIYKRRSLVG